MYSNVQKPHSKQANKSPAASSSSRPFQMPHDRSISHTSCLMMMLYCLAVLLAFLYPSALQLWQLVWYAPVFFLSTCFVHQLVNFRTQTTARNIRTLFQYTLCRAAHVAFGAARADCFLTVGAKYRAAHLLITLFLLLSCSQVPSWSVARRTSCPPSL